MSHPMTPLIDGLLVDYRYFYQLFWRQPFTVIDEQMMKKSEGE